MDSNIIKNSQKSADVQLAKNLNTVVAMAEAEGNTPASMYDVLYYCSQAGFLIEKLNPTTDGYYYAWDQSLNKILYVCSSEDGTLDTVEYPEDVTLNPANCWITVGDQEEAERVANAGYNLYLKNSIEKIELHSVAVSINTGVNKLGALVIDGQLANEKAISLVGTFEGSTAITASNVKLSTSGTMNSLSLGSNIASANIGSRVTSLSNSSSKTTLGTLGKVTSVTSNTGTILNSQNKVVETTSGGSLSGAVDGKLEIGSKEDIENIRTQIANGETFSGETVTLKSDIDMGGIMYQPISNYGRSDSALSAAATTWFSGDIDGQGYEISNFSTSGFSLEKMNASTNSTSSPFGVDKVIYNESIYGLFGAVYVPEGETMTIKNIEISCNIDLVIDDELQLVGDSVGGLIGYVYGSGNLVVENCTVGGTIKGYDGVGGLIGRACRTVSITFKNCTNNANVTGVRKTGAFIGTSYTNGLGVTYINCVNNGKIECLGGAYDVSIGGVDKGNSGKCGGYYFASQSSPESGWAASSDSGIKYNGSTYLAGVLVTESTTYSDHITSGKVINQ